MGKKGKEIVRANITEVIDDLNKVYCDEWLAHFQYWYTAKWIKGLDADTLGLFWRSNRQTSWATRER